MRPMQLAQVRRNSDPFGRYYTQGGVAKLLVSSMGASPTGVVIELGAGDGALVGEASKHWKAAQFVTVDIDKNAGTFNLPRSSDTAFSHHIADALDPHLSQKIGLSVGTVHSALCNPPYVKPKWRKHFGQILEEAGLSGVFPRIGSVPADILFIAQNLRFLRDGGKLGLILPDGIIAGEKCSELRKTLANSHHLERVIELPRRVFCGTEAKAYVVVLTKNGKPAEEIELQRLEGDGSLTGTLHLDAERAGTRLDYSFHVSSTSRVKARHLVLRDIAVSVGRGSISSSERKQCDLPIFHTTDFGLTGQFVPRSFQLSKAKATSLNTSFAYPGDILIARVGRNLEDKVAFVEKGFVAISDCVLRLRIHADYQERVFKYLVSEAGRDALRAASHGVGAKFITVDSLLNMTVRG